MAAGGEHSLAASDATVWGWGRNNYGQVGDGTAEHRFEPVPIGRIAGATALAAGWEFSLALRPDGMISAWGLNLQGQLGDGTTVLRRTPVLVQEIHGISTMAAGNAHSIAIGADGTVWGWGRGAFGALAQAGSGNQVSPGGFLTSGQCRRRREETTAW